MVRRRDRSRLIEGELLNVIETAEAALDRFETGGARQDLDRALAGCRAAVAASTPASPLHRRAVDSLVMGLMAGPERGTTDELVDVGRQSLDIAGDRVAECFARETLALALLVRHQEFTESDADLAESVDHARRALDSPPERFLPAAVHLRSILAEALGTRYERTGSLRDIGEATEFASLALRTAPADHPELEQYAGLLAELLGLFGQALHAAVSDGQEPPGLGEALRDYLRQVEQAPATAPSPVPKMIDIGLGLLFRAQRTAALSEAEDVVEYGRRLLAVARGRPEASVTHLVLADALLLRVDVTGSPVDLDEAVDLLREAVAMVAVDDPKRSHYLSELALAVRKRFDRAGSLADADQAVTLFRQVLDLTPVDDTDRPPRLVDLSVGLAQRFQHGGALADLDEAVDLLHEAIRLTDASQPKYLRDLAEVLEERGEQTGSAADLDDAGGWARRAVEVTPADDGDWPTPYAVLAAVLVHRFTRNHDPADSDEAIALLRRATAGVPEDDPRWSKYTADLAVAVRTRYEISGVADTMDDTIDRTRRALAGTPADDRGRPLVAYDLARLLECRFREHGAAADSRAALAGYEGAARDPVLPPVTRVDAAARWGTLAAEIEDWPAAVAGFTVAVDVLPLLASPEVGRRTGERRLVTVVGLARHAAGCALRAGQPVTALALLEQGRGVLLAGALESSGELAALARQAPDLAREFRRLRDRLNDEAERTGSGDPVADRRRAVRELDDVVRRIRALPGLDRFLRAPTAAELGEGTGEGPTVLLNVSHYRSDALVLTPGGVRVAPLPELHPDEAAARTERLLAAVSGADPWADVDAVVRETLGWLWEVVVAPVLAELPRARRIWWVPTGVLGFLPIHAAQRNGTGLLDQVVSSYAPTARVLSHVRRLPGSRADRRLLAVGMPTTPDAPPLPGVAAELAALAERVPDVVSVVGPAATCGRVSAELERSTWAHFACHGASDLVDPSGGRLLLHDHAERPFSVRHVGTLRLPDAELAYLSACETAQPGEQLADEGIHLSSAFQVAGFRHVIASLWRIHDDVAVGVASDVYEALLAGDAPANALHAAIRRVRDRCPDRPSLWAPYLHTGP